MDARDLHALSLLAELQRMSTNDNDEAVRITIRSADGSFLGEAFLPEAAAQEATNAFSVAADYRQSQQAIPYTPTDGTAPELDITDVLVGADPLLVADIEDLFDAVDPQSYLDDVMAADEPESAAAAYEQFVTGEWDGDL